MGQRPNSVLAALCRHLDVGDPSGGEVLGLAWPSQAGSLHPPLQERDVPLKLPQLQPRAPDVLQLQLL
jgi:hypothetical protein